jgi:hypothetical protein
MIIEALKIPTSTKPIEAFAMHHEPKPDKVFLILPGKEFTIHHFLLDFMWRMAAEAGFFAIKAEFRGYTYKHQGEPYDHEHAIEDAGFVMDYLINTGYIPNNITFCTKSLGTIALAGLVAKSAFSFDKAILLTPVLYYQKESGVFPVWNEYNQKVKQSYIVFGDDDPYCDLDTAKSAFPKGLIESFIGADHGLNITADYLKTMEIQQKIIEQTKLFITKQ